MREQPALQMHSKVQRHSILPGSLLTQTVRRDIVSNFLQVRLKDVTNDSLNFRRNMRLELGWRTEPAAVLQAPKGCARKWKPLYYSVLKVPPKPSHEYPPLVYNGITLGHLLIEGFGALLSGDGRLYGNGF